MKFTKGDWKRNGFNHVGTEQKPVCFVYTELCSKEEAVANAKLIAAAPDLLESCISLLADLRQVLINDCLGQDMDEDTGIRYAESFDVVQRAKAAIKKATA